MQYYFLKYTSRHFDQAYLISIGNHRRTFCTRHTTPFLILLVHPINEFLSLTLFKFLLTPPEKFAKVNKK
jgi:hypothetical protein